MADIDTPSVDERAADANDASQTPSPEAEIAALREEVAQTKDQMLRRAAEFENYRRRLERERADWLMFANEKVLLEMLPVVDDLERSLAAARATQQEDPMYAGIEMIKQKLMKTLESFGVKPFESTGQPFNVDLHEALMQVQRDDVAPHTVVEEIQRGYYLNDKVLRHAKVVVSGEKQ